MHRQSYGDVMDDRLEIFAGSVLQTNTTRMQWLALILAQINLLCATVYTHRQSNIYMHEPARYCIKFPWSTPAGNRGKDSLTGRLQIDVDPTAISRSKMVTMGINSPSPAKRHLRQLRSHRVCANWRTYTYVRIVIGDNAGCARVSCYSSASCSI